MSATILVVDDEENFRRYVGTYLTSKGYEVIGAATLEEARNYVNKGSADIILLDVELPDGYGPNLLEEIAMSPYRIPVIVITGVGDIDMAVHAMKNGAHDFLQKPIEFDRLEQSIHRAEDYVAMRRELFHLRQSQQNQLDFIIGKSSKMLELVDMAQRAAAACVSVLITGETGTGKEVLARFIHKTGPRDCGNPANRPFIDVNCGAIQSTVFESELFGHEPGAFTSAEKRKNGLMEIANNGILFLDEISALPLDIQVKLLRALEERSFRRVGGTNLIRVDVQILAASNKDLPRMIEEQKFRSDLYYRLKVVDLHLPPLRERKEDIPELVGLFIRQNNPRFRVNITDVTPRAMDALLAYEWPGNIRQLKNAIDRAMLFCDDPAIDLSHLPEEVRNAAK